MADLWDKFSKKYEEELAQAKAATKLEEDAGRLLRGQGFPKPGRVVSDDEGRLRYRPPQQIRTADIPAKLPEVERLPGPSEGIFSSRLSTALEGRAKTAETPELAQSLRREAQRLAPAQDAKSSQPKREKKTRGVPVLGALQAVVTGRPLPEGDISGSPASFKSALEKQFGKTGATEVRQEQRAGALRQRAEETGLVPLTGRNVATILEEAKRGRTVAGIDPSRFQLKRGVVDREYGEMEYPHYVDPTGLASPIGSLAERTFTADKPVDYIETDPGLAAAGDKRDPQLEAYAKARALLEGLPLSAKQKAEMADRMVVTSPEIAKARAAGKGAAFEGESVTDILQRYNPGTAVLGAMSDISRFLGGDQQKTDMFLSALTGDRVKMSEFANLDPEQYAESLPPSMANIARKITQIPEAAGDVARYLRTNSLMDVADDLKLYQVGGFGVGSNAEAPSLGASVVEGLSKLPAETVGLIAAPFHAAQAAMSPKPLREQVGDAGKLAGYGVRSMLQTLSDPVASFEEGPMTMAMNMALMTPLGKVSKQQRRAIKDMHAERRAASAKLAEDMAELRRRDLNEPIVARGDDFDLAGMTSDYMDIAQKRVIASKRAVRRIEERMNQFARNDVVAGNLLSVAASIVNPVLAPVEAAKIIGLRKMLPLRGVEKTYGKGAERHRGLTAENRTQQEFIELEREATGAASKDMMDMQEAAQLVPLEDRQTVNQMLHMEHAMHADKKTAALPEGLAVFSPDRKQSLLEPDYNTMRFVPTEAGMKAFGLNTAEDAARFSQGLPVSPAGATPAQLEARALVQPDLITFNRYGQGLLGHARNLELMAKDLGLLFNDAARGHYFPQLFGKSAREQLESAVAHAKTKSEAIRKLPAERAQAVFDLPEQAQSALRESRLRMAAKEEAKRGVPPEDRFFSIERREKDLGMETNLVTNVVEGMARARHDFEMFKLYREMAKDSRQVLTADQHFALRTSKDPAARRLADEFIEIENSYLLSEQATKATVLRQRAKLKALQKKHEAYERVRKTARPEDHPKMAQLEAEIGDLLGMNQSQVQRFLTEERRLPSAKASRDEARAAVKAARAENEAVLAAERAVVRANEQLLDVGDQLGSIRGKINDELRQFSAEKPKKRKKEDKDPEELEVEREMVEQMGEDLGSAAIRWADGVEARRFREEMPTTIKDGPALEVGAEARVWADAILEETVLKRDELAALADLRRRLAQQSGEKAAKAEQAKRGYLAADKDAAAYAARKDVRPKAVERLMASDRSRGGTIAKGRAPEAALAAAERTVERTGATAERLAVNAAEAELMLQGKRMDLIRKKLAKTLGREPQYITAEMWSNPYSPLRTARAEVAAAKRVDGLVKKYESVVNGRLDRALKAEQAAKAQQGFPVSTRAALKDAQALAKAKSIAARHRKFQDMSVRQQSKWQAAMNEAQSMGPQVARDLEKQYTAVERARGPRRYGDISGKFVREGIANEIMQAHELVRQMNSGKWGNLLRFWKLGKTAFSPATTSRNLLTNVLLFAPMANVSPFNPANVPHFAKALKDLLVPLTKRSKMYKEAVRDKALGGNVYKNELASYNALAPMRGFLGRVDDLAANIPSLLMELSVRAPGQNWKGPWMAWKSNLGKSLKGRRQFVEGMKRTFSRVLGGPGAFYGALDDVFRLAYYYKQRSIGTAGKVAGDGSKKNFIDYDGVAGFVNTLRSGFTPMVQGRRAPQQAPTMRVRKAPGPDGQPGLRWKPDMGPDPGVMGLAPKQHQYGKVVFSTVGRPFLAFTAQAVPLFQEWMMKNPLKGAAYLNLFNFMTDMYHANAGLNADDEFNRMRALPSYELGRSVPASFIDPSMARGEPVERYGLEQKPQRVVTTLGTNILGSLFQGADLGVDPGYDSYRALMTVLGEGSPISQLFRTFADNRESFTGASVTPRSGFVTPGTLTADLMSVVTSKMLPPDFPGFDLPGFDPVVTLGEAGEGVQAAQPRVRGGYSYEKQRAADLGIEDRRGEVLDPELVRMQRRIGTGEKLVAADDAAYSVAVDLGNQFKEGRDKLAEQLGIRKELYGKQGAKYEEGLRNMVELSVAPLRRFERKLRGIEEREMPVTPKMMPAFDQPSIREMAPSESRAPKRFRPDDPDKSFEASVLADAIRMFLKSVDEGDSIDVKAALLEDVVDTASRMRSEYDKDRRERLNLKSYMSGD